MPLPQPPTQPGLTAPPPQPGQPQATPQNPIGQLFAPVGPQPPQNRPNNTVKRGAIVLFTYQNWMHDPSPMILVTDVQPGNRIRGVNLHYLTFPVIKQLLNNAKMSLGGISYRNITGQQYIVAAFRSYKWQSIRQLKVLDINYVLNALGTVRSFDPAEVEKMRRAVQEQLKRIVNPREESPDQEAQGINTAAPQIQAAGTNLVPSAAPNVPTVGTTPVVGVPNQGIE